MDITLVADSFRRAATDHQANDRHKITHLGFRFTGVNAHIVIVKVQIAGADTEDKPTATDLI